MQIAIIRSYKKDVKFYLYDVTLFSVEHNTWVEVSTHQWEFLQLGKEMSGRYYGDEKSDDYYGFEALWKIE